MAKPKSKKKKNSAVRVPGDNAAQTVSESEAIASTPAKAVPFFRSAQKKKAESESADTKQVKKADTSKSVKKTDQNKKPSLIKRLVEYLQNVKAELKRVTWPTKREVLNSSLVVVGTLIFFGVLIYLIDTGVVPLLVLFSKIG